MTTQPTTATITPDKAIVDLLSGLWLSRAVYAAAKLGLADMIGEEARPVSEIARETSTHPGSLYRLMSALASAGYFVEQPDRKFGQTALSQMLRSDVPGSLRYTAISELGGDHYAAWENLLYGVRTGDIPFNQRFGMPVWQYYDENPESGETFGRSMTAITQSIHEAMISAYSFMPFRRIVDIGGGQGSLLSYALLENPQASGIVFDRADVVAAAAERLEQAGLADRCIAVAGDFFEAVPQGADLHILKWIIHDWDDAEARQILQNSRSSIVSGGRLLLIETILPEPNDGLFPRLMDLNMMVMTGGRERTEAAYGELLGRAGYRLLRVIATKSPVSIIEAEPV